MPDLFSTGRVWLLSIGCKACESESRGFPNSNRMTQISSPGSLGEKVSEGKVTGARRPPARMLARLWGIPATRALAALGFVIAIGCLFNADGAFLKIGTHRDALRQASVFGVLACGLTLVIISGGVDLAVGRGLALVAGTFSVMSVYLGWGPGGLLSPCLLIGAACGAGFA